MPKIVINEVDLTKASLQPSPTDIAFVPGLSCLSDPTLDATYCETISDFEENFGKYPSIINVYRVYSLNGTINFRERYYIINYNDFNRNFYDEIYRNFIYKRINKYGGSTLAGTTQLVLGYNTTLAPTEEDIDSYLDACGFAIAPNQESVPEGSKTDYLDFDYDLSYVYAKELIMAGIPVIYQVVEGSTYSEVLNSIEGYFTDAISNPDSIRDKGEFSIKYLTSGAYPSFAYTATKTSRSYDCENVEPSFATNMLNLAGERGDCVALIDPADCTNDSLDSSDNVIRDIYKEQLINPETVYEAATTLLDNINFAEYGAFFVPWALYNTQANYNVGINSVTRLPQLDSVIMPPSFGYMMALAKSIRSNNNWLAIAGIARGQVPYIRGLYTTRRLTNKTAAETYQPRNGKTSLNGITDIKPYGLTIWGNRTMKNNEDNAMGGDDGLTATSFLNIRNMVSDVKKTAYIAAKTLMFEQNSDVLWVNFLSRITPLLDQLMSGQGLSDYKIVKNYTDEKAKLKATIILYPIYAVEDFEITIELRDEDVSVV